MFAKLSTITSTQAAWLIREVQFDDRLAGYKMGAMSGSEATSFYTLREVCNFIKVPEMHKLFTSGSGASIGYVDFAKLATWVGDILGDDELAQAIRQAEAASESYAAGMQQVRALIQQRLQQCSEILERKPDVETLNSKS